MIRDERGRIDLRLPNGFTLRRFTAATSFDLAGARMRLDLAHRSAVIEVTDDGGLTARAVEPLSGVALDVSVRVDRDGLVVESAIENTGAATVCLREAGLLGGALLVPERVANARLFKNGWSVASPAGWIDAETGDPALEMRLPPRLLRLVPRWLRWMTHDPHPTEPVRKGRTTSEGLLAIAARRGGPTLLVGALGCRRFFTSHAFDSRTGSLTSTQWGDGAELRPGTRVELEPIVFMAGERAEALLEIWAERVGRSNGARIPTERRVAWATWYAGAYKGLDERWVHERVAALSACRAPVDSVIVDDGYQIAHGDWLEPSPRLPSGLPALARHIRDAGYAPGLWIAPFAVAGESRVARAHPDWLVRDERGRPLATAMILSYGRLTPTFSLDTTHPEVLAHLEATAAQLVEHGFEILKVDFLTAAAAPGLRFDRGATRAMAYARGMEALRRGAGHATLVAAIAPLLANVGWVDCQRLSPDTAYGKNRWLTLPQRWLNERSSPGIRNNVATTLARAFLGGRLYGADPDAIVFDGLSPELHELLATVDVLGAHLVSLGHDFAKSAADLGVVERLLALPRGTVQVPDSGSLDGLARELHFQSAAGGTLTVSIEPRSGSLAPAVRVVKQSSR